MSRPSRLVGTVGPLPLAALLGRLARTMGYAGGDGERAAAGFRADHRRHTEAVRAIFLRVVRKEA